MKIAGEYIIYDSEDLPIFIGDVFECSNFLKVTVSGFRMLVTRTKNGKNKGNYYSAYRILEELYDLEGNDDEL